MTKEQETQTAEKSSEFSLKKKRGRSEGPGFPRDSLKKALRLAESIEKNNAGEPYDRLDLAKTVGFSPNSSGFRVLIISSGRYGITQGGYSADKIELTSLGSSIVAPTINDDPKVNMRKALTNPEIFQDVFERFNKKNIPREEVFQSTLKKDFSIPPQDVDSCYKVIMQNIDELGLSQEISGNQFLNMDKLGEISKEVITTAKPSDTSQIMEGLEEPEPKKEIVKPKQIFVAHGKNKKPLEQLEKILNRFKVNYKVAKDEPHSGRPISVKVTELMKSCTSGIFIFTADEETKDAEDNVVWRPSDNVVYELGAASVIYGNKIVIFKENDVKFASDYSDLGYISFEKDNLDSKAGDLITELINMGFMQLTPT